MATYCTVDDVIAWLPQGLSIDAGTVPSSATVEAMIVNVGDEIDAVLDSRGYALPIDPKTTDPALQRALSLLETANLYGALSKFFAVKYASQAAGAGHDAAAKWAADWEHLRSDLETMKIGLADPREDAIGGFEDDADPWVRRGSVF